MTKTAMLALGCLAMLASCCPRSGRTVSWDGDEIFEEIDRCGLSCSDISIATE